MLTKIETEFVQFWKNRILAKPHAVKIEDLKEAYKLINGIDYTGTCSSCNQTLGNELVKIYRRLAVQEFYKEPEVQYTQFVEPIEEKVDEDKPLKSKVVKKK